VQLKLQLLAIFGSAVLLGIVFELLRRRRLIERYALIWLGSAVVLLGLAVWKDLLEIISKAMGIVYPPNALFMIAFGFVLLLLLHFSIAISRLSGEGRWRAGGRSRGVRRPGARPDRAAPRAHRPPVASDDERPAGRDRCRSGDRMRHRGRGAHRRGLRSAEIR
jgi:hypothetical protein